MGGKREMGHEQQVDEFLALFDGDLIQAMRALQKRAHAVDAKIHPKKQPTPAYGGVLIEVQDVVKKYKVGRQKIDALAGVSLTVHQGEFVAITGTSGSGKSTLLQLMGGLDKPTAGTIRIDGTDLGKMSDRKLSQFRGETIGFVFQFFYLQPFLKLGQNLEVPGMFMRANRTDRKQRVDDLARAVDLGDRVGHLPKELSGGQMQRAAIARALFNNPKVLLADEPTGNLDSKNSTAIIELFERIRREFGTTIIIVTHDRSIAAQADREIRMKDGEII